MLKLFFIFIVFFNVAQVQGLKKTILVFGGKTGWVGSKLVVLLKEQGHKVVCAESRLENRENIIQEIERVKPDFIINAASITGRPNSDWCEDYKDLTIRANVIGSLNIIDIAYLYGIHVTNIGTACTYVYDEKHPKWSGRGFLENDYPNIQSTIYFKTKIVAEYLMNEYPNVLNLRLSFPLASDYSPRNMLIRLLHYKKVINEPNSWVVLDELLPIAIDMMFKKKIGCYNFSNPGVITHHELLDLYKQYVDKDFTYDSFSVEEQNKILKGNRPMFELDVSKLLEEYPQILFIKEAVKKNLIKMKNQKVKN